MTAPRRMPRLYDRRRPVAFAALEIGALLFMLVCMLVSVPPTYPFIAVYSLMNCIGILAVTRLRLNIARLVLIALYGFSCIAILCSLAFQLDLAIRAPDVLLRAFVVIVYAVVTMGLLMTPPVSPWCKSGNLPFFDRMKSRFDRFR
ncbi:hypothetical protein [uncultured Croceicoccus sp.]|uniref:hypothetical protein n=1 Tax=uncultured Croceicoccus sp. TaxID=1295329 RepID=UPI002626B781|nr:hypothetical protein [uncultured Croceicoccus sp.]